MSDFLNFVISLRNKEEIHISNHITAPSDTEEGQVIAFLEKEFEKEQIEYLYTLPEYNKKGAIWGAKVLYYLTHFQFNRTLANETLTTDFLNINEFQNHSGIYSIDLSLRFLPYYVTETFKSPEDLEEYKFIEILKKEFHFSLFPLIDDYNFINWNSIQSHPTLMKILAERALHSNNLKLGEFPLINKYIKQGLGNYQKHYWNNLE